MVENQARRIIAGTILNGESIHESVQEWLLWRSGQQSRYPAKLEMPYIVMIGFEYLISTLNRGESNAVSNRRMQDITQAVADSLMSK